MNLGATNEYEVGTVISGSLGSTDKASQEWGSTWTVPTEDDVTELIDNVTWEYTRNPGSLSSGKTYTDNCYFTGTSKVNGNKIIFPAYYFHYTGSSDRYEREMCAIIRTQTSDKVFHISVMGYYETVNEVRITTISALSDYCENRSTIHIRPVTNR